MSHGVSAQGSEAEPDVHFVFSYFSQVSCHSDEKLAGMNSLDKQGHCCDCGKDGSLWELALEKPGEVD